MLLINLGDQPCDTSIDWCGWKNVRGWKRVKYQELDQVYQDDSDAKDIGSDEGNYLQFPINLPILIR